MKKRFIQNLMQKFPKINYNILGVSNHEPKWNYDYYEELSKCKIALNLSRGEPLSILLVIELLHLLAMEYTHSLMKKPNLLNFLMKLKWVIIKIIMI